MRSLWLAETLEVALDHTLEELGKVIVFVGRNRS